ncbi:MAG: hypothetical protein ACRYG8_20280 [Janthinobacterium lividum]
MGDVLCLADRVGSGLCSLPANLPHRVTNALQIFNGFPNSVRFTYVAH